jgi:Ca2+-transporting ATPase
MDRPPRDPASPLLLRKRILWAVVQGVIVFAVLGGVLIGADRLGVSEPDLRALVFTSLVLMNMGLIFVNRSFKSSLAQAFLRPNRSLRFLLGGVAVLLATAVFWPPAQALFHFGRLHWDDLGVCAVAGIGSLLLLEALKARWFRADGAAPKAS